MNAAVARAGLVLAALLVVAIAAPRAWAEPPATVDLGPAHLVVAGGWSADDANVLRGPGGAVLVLVRQPVGNLPAWSASTREAHVDELIAGFVAVDGARVVSRTLSHEAASEVPVLDLLLLRDGRPVAVRVILFRTLTAVAAATAARDAPATRAALARAVAGLHPDR